MNGERRSRGRDALRSTLISFEDNKRAGNYFFCFLSVRGNQRERTKRLLRESKKMLIEEAALHVYVELGVVPNGLYSSSAAQEVRV